MSNTVDKMLILSNGRAALVPLNSNMRTSSELIMLIAALIALMDPGTLSSNRIGLPTICNHTETLVPLEFRYWTFIPSVRARSASLYLYISGSPAYTNG
jgi:hypothetical protein